MIFLERESFRKDFAFTQSDLLIDAAVLSAFERNPNLAEMLHLRKKILEEAKTIEQWISKELFGEYQPPLLPEEWDKDLLHDMRYAIYKGYVDRTFLPFLARSIFYSTGTVYEPIYFGQYGERYVIDATAWRYLLMGKDMPIVVGLLNKVRSRNLLQKVTVLEPRWLEELKGVSFLRYLSKNHDRYHRCYEFAPKYGSSGSYKVEIPIDTIAEVATDIAKAFLSGDPYLFELTSPSRSNEVDKIIRFSAPIRRRYEEDRQMRLLFEEKFMERMASSIRRQFGDLTATPQVLSNHLNDFSKWRWSPIKASRWKTHRRLRGNSMQDSAVFPFRRYRLWAVYFGRYGERYIVGTFSRPCCGGFLGRCRVKDVAFLFVARLFGIFEAMRATL